MGDIGYGYGSEWHLLRVLGRHQQHFNRQIEAITVLKDCGAKVMEWLDFGFSPTHWTLDEELKGVDFLQHERPEVWQAWFDHWPDHQQGQRNPPNWDAVGKIRINGEDEYLLVEAKAHTQELKSGGCGAQGESRRMIRNRLGETFMWVAGIHQIQWQPEEGIADDVERLLGQYYQYANRLAVLRFLRMHKVRARLLFVYFCGDQSTDPGAVCPADEAGWQPFLTSMNEELLIQDGLGEEATPLVHKLFINVAPGRGTPPLQRNPWWSPRRPGKAPPWTCPAECSEHHVHPGVHD